jgi:hypothetical protein
VRVGQIWFGFVIIVLFGLRMLLVFSTLTWSERKINISLEKAVKLDTDLSHSS